METVNRDYWGQKGEGNVELLLNGQSFYLRRCKSSGNGKK